MMADDATGNKSGLEGIPTVFSDHVLDFFKKLRFKEKLWHSLTATDWREARDCV